MNDREEGIKQVGDWIEKEGDETDYSGDEYEGKAWIIYPAEVEALKRGELPQAKDRHH